MSSSHDIVDLAEGLEQEKEGRPSFCQHHPSLELKGFCDTCQVVTCAECFMLEHSRHTIRSIGEVAKEVRPSLQQLSERVAEKSGLGCL